MKVFLLPCKFEFMLVAILNEVQIKSKIKRLAWQVYEQYHQEQHIIICGISVRGFILAKKIAHDIQEISSIKVEIAQILMDKDNPIVEEITLSPNISVKGKTVILCDDVLYTGKTLAFACIPFLTNQVKEIQCLVLVNRNHLKFPMQPNFIGMNLASTLQEHVNVDFEKMEVSLN